MADRFTLVKRVGLAVNMAALLGLVVAVYFCWFYPKTTVIVLRHAERDANQGLPDEQIPLNQAGHDRAAELSRVLERAGVTAIYVTQKLRTQQTAQPLANSRNITPTQFNATDTDALINDVLARRNRGGVVVVINHSENVPDIVNRLGGGAVTVGGNEFDNLFVLTLSHWGAERLVKATYGAPR